MSKNLSKWFRELVNKACREYLAYASLIPAELFLALGELDTALGHGGTLQMLSIAGVPRPCRVAPHSLCQSNSTFTCSQSKINALVK